MIFGRKLAKSASRGGRWRTSKSRTAPTAPLPNPVAGSRPTTPLRLPSAELLAAPAPPEDATDQVLRGTSFGDQWIEVHTGRRYEEALNKLVARRGRTGPKSMRVDDAVVRLAHGEVQVCIGTAVVGVLDGSATSAYKPILEATRRPVESSGIVVIDARGHPGTHFKLYLPEPGMVVPANTLNPVVPMLPAWDRAGGLTLARSQAEHALVAAATASWWTGTARSAWVVLTRSNTGITATMDDLPLPTLDPGRSVALRSVWEVRHPDVTRLQFEAQVYEIKSGRQVNIRYPPS